MAERLRPRELTERDLEILKDVILAHILHAEPVSSRTVAKVSRHDLSAASIRNIMADLEDWGYLCQPHTSAGRVPTREGYHLYIDSLMDSRTVPAKERRYIESNLRTSDAEHLMAAAGHMLSELSHQLSIVLTPNMGETVLRTVEFAPVAERKVLCVVVSSDGFVDNKLIEVEEPIERRELRWIGNYLTENYSGMTLRQIRDRLLGLMAEERDQVDRLLRLTIDLAGRGLEPSREQDVLLEGTSEVLSQPELSDIGRVRQLFDTFAQKARLVQILTRCVTGAGVRVLIGEDSDLTSELDFSLVTTGYGAGGRSLGTLAIFGPSRMEYDRVIPLVHYLGQSLSRALSESFAGSKEEQ